VKIGICQILCLDGDRQGNLVRIERAVGEAAGASAQIAVLPETALLGWVNPDAHTRAQPIPGADTARLAQIARKHGIYVCVGLAEKAGADLYDSAIVLDSEGKTVLKHRKINLLAELMDPPYTAGRDVQVVETPFGRIGVLICADTHDEAILDRMARLGPDLLLVPYGYAEEEEKWPGHGRELERVVCNTARRVGAFTVGVNCVGAITHGPWAGRVYGGQSLAADKTGRVIARAADRDRDVIIVEYEPS